MKLADIKGYPSESNSSMWNDDAFVTRFEKIPVQVYPSAVAGSAEVAARIAKLVKERRNEGRNVVLGLATGSTPLIVYNELIRWHKQDGLSFSNVITFNLDEYYPLEHNHQQSYNHFMWDRLFKHLDIKAENIHIPSGSIDQDDVAAFCRDYERKISEAGGIDIQLLGIGRTGHIGFNEPGSAYNSKTRLVSLDRLTRNDAADSFNGEEQVPHFAITMGVGTIMASKDIFRMAWGEGQAEILEKALEGQVTDVLP